MKKILAVFLLISSTVISFGEELGVENREKVAVNTDDHYAFFGNFFGNKKKDREIQSQQGSSSVEIDEESGETREIPQFLEFKYIDKETEKEQTFQVIIEPVQAGDKRPPEIASIEKAIAEEKIREKVTPMMKYYDKFFREYLDKISNDPEKIYQLGNQYFVNRQYEKAKDIFSKNIDTVDNLFGAAVTNRFLGYDNTAIDYYSEVIYMEPKLAEPYLGRGICYRNLGQYKEALGDFLKYKSLNNSEEAYTALGNIYILREEYEKAKQVLKEGRMVYPNSKLINDLLVKAYAK